MLLREIRIINEEALETKNVEDLWGENSDSASWYVNSAEYHVREIPDTNPQMYEVFSVDGDTRKPFGKFTTSDLSDVLEPIRAGQKPDAEGFTTYIDSKRVRAFEYDGDPVKVLIGNTGMRLDPGSFVVRTNDGNDFQYAIEKRTIFNATLNKVS